MADAPEPESPRLLCAFVVGQELVNVDGALVARPFLRPLPDVRPGTLGEQREVLRSLAAELDRQSVANALVRRLVTTPQPERPRIVSAHGLPPPELRDLRRGRG